MSIKLSTLVTKLSGMVPARGDVPNPDQYEQCVQDAIADFGRRASMEKIATISIIKGTESYALPADFLKVISLETLSTPDGVIISSAGLIPVNADWVETYTVAGSTITFQPTPTYTLDRDLWYAAGYVLNDEDDPAYADLTEAVSAIIMKEAQALALDLQANAAVNDAWSYSIGDERVSKEQLSTKIQARADALHDQFDRRVKDYIGTVGMRAIVLDTE